MPDARSFCGVAYLLNGPLAGTGRGDGHLEDTVVVGAAAGGSLLLGGNGRGDGLGSSGSAGDKSGDECDGPHCD